MVHVPKILRLCFAIAAACMLATRTAAQTVVVNSPTITTATAQTAVVPFGVCTTPAALASEEHSLVAVWIVPSRLGVAQLRTSHALVGYSTQPWTAAVSIGTLGTDRYTELGLSSLVATNLTERLRVGVALNYVFARAYGFAAENLVTVNAQMVFALDSLTRLGIAGSNLLQYERAGSTRGSMGQLSIGAGRQILSSLWLDADLTLPLRSSSGLVFAVRWDAIELLSIRFAAATIPKSADVTVRLDAFDGACILLGLHYHAALGITSSLGVSYRW